MNNGNNVNASVGGLRVAVTALRGYFPVEGAKVEVFSGEYTPQNVIATAITDQSGNTTVLSLPAPAKELSQNAGEQQLPYMIYNLFVTARGYIDQYNLGIPVFSGVTSLQGVDLTPLSAEGENTGPVIIDETSTYNL